MNTFVNQYLVDNSETQNDKSWNTNGTRLNFWVKTRLKHVKRHHLLRLNQTQTYVLYTSATNLFKRKLLTYIIRSFLPYQKHSKIYLGLYTQHYIKARTFKREKVLTSHWPATGASSLIVLGIKRRPVSSRTKVETYPSEKRCVICGTFTRASYRCVHRERTSAKIKNFV